MIQRYFEEEMRYLHEAGKAFAEAHPDVAQYLNVDSLSDRDPYVERLFEGFALLSGRIHEHLDDAQPEYTESLFSLLYPHFLKPIPALCIMQMTPKPGLVQQTTVLEKGTEVRSEPVGEESAVCRFVTTHDIRLQPLRLTDAQVRYASGGVSSIYLQFTVERGADVEQLDLSPLRLYLQVETGTAAALHQHLTRHVRHVDLRCEGEGSVRLHGQQWVQPAGLGEDEGLLPYGPRSFVGFRLLQEYLCFRPKFWAVDLLGLDRVPFGDGGSRFDVEIALDRSFPDDRRFSADNIRLYCAPAVNLFTMDAEPIRVEGRETEYRVLPSTRYRKSIVAYDVLDVVGVEDVSGRRHAYRPYFDDRRTSDGDRYYTVRRRAGVLDHPELYLSLSGDGAEDVAGLVPETLSVQIRATNGTLPRERLQEGMIKRLAPDVPQIVEAVNLRAPTLIHYPPSTDDPEYFWTLVSHLSLNFQSMASPEALLGLLELYDWTETSANRRRLSGIRDVQWQPKEIVRRGALLRGAEVVVEVQEGFFAEEGDLCLFGTVLSSFLSMAATINAFVHLKIVLIPSGKEFEWQPQRGVTPVL